MYCLGRPSEVKKRDIKDIPSRAFPGEKRSKEEKRKVENKLS
jgi:hypothetical protein